MTLTKQEIVTKICEDVETLTQAEAADIVQKTLNCITAALSKGDKVELRNFGVFDVKVCKPRTGRNPKDPKGDIHIPARSIVKFKAGKVLRLEVLKLTPKAVKLKKKKA